MSLPDRTPTRSTPGAWRLPKGAVAGLLALAAACGGRTEAERLAEAREMLQTQNVLGAIIAYKDVLKRFPEGPGNLEARFGLAYAYFLDKDYKKALETAEELISRAGAGSDIAVNAAALRLDALAAQRLYAEALDEALRTSDTLRSTSAEIRHQYYLRMADLMIANQRTTDSLAVLMGVLREPTLTPLGLQNQRIAMVNIVGFHMVTGDVEGAATALEGYLERHPASPLVVEVESNIGLLWKQAGQAERGEAHFGNAEAELRRRLEEAVGSDQKSEVMMGLAQIELFRERIDEAQTIYRRIIDDYPLGRLRPAAMIALAEAYFREGDAETALDLFSQVAESYPNSPEAFQARQRSQQVMAARAGDLPTTTSLPAAPPLQSAPAPALPAEPAEPPPAEAEPEP